MTARPGTSAGPGKRTLTELLAVRPGGPRDWQDLTRVLELPGAQGGAPPGAARPAGRGADARGPIQRQEAPGGGHSPTADTAPLDAAGIKAELDGIASSAGQQLDLGTLQGLAISLAGLQPTIAAIADTGQRSKLTAQLATTQDLVVGQFQALAAQHADQTLQAWSTATPDERRQQRAEYQREAWYADPSKYPLKDGAVVSEDWCGMFADAQFRASGFAPEFAMAFNSVVTVAEFFQYVASSHSPGTIEPFGKDPQNPLHQPVRPVQGYHADRGSTRSFHQGAAIGDDIRPGDILTINLDAGAAADHVCIVASYTSGTPGRLVTIDGNAYGASKPGSQAVFDGSSMTKLGDKTTNDVATNAYDRTGDAAHPDFDRSAMLPKGVKAFRTITIVGRGRPSMVDFEHQHTYPNFKGPTDGPQGPIQRREHGAVATGDPAAAFDAATTGGAGEIPHRAEMQQRFGADFSSVQAYTGRDLSGLAAHAATRGEQVAFASSAPDRETVAHELAHVVQARNGTAGSAAVSDPGDASEHEARGVAASVAAGDPVKLGAAPSAAIHRQDKGGATAPAPDGAQDAYYAQISTLIDQFVKQYHALPITVSIGPPASPGAAAPTTTVAVSVPYWNNDSTKWKQSDATKQGAAYPLPRPSDAYLQANGSEASNAFRDQQLPAYDKATNSKGTAGSAVAESKGSPDEIRGLVQHAVDHQLIPAPSVTGSDPAVWAPAWKTAIELWMQQTGIGLDCNGLVYQALAQIQQLSGTRTTGQAEGHASVFEYYGAIGASGQVKDKRTSVAVDQLGALGDRVEPIDLEPGDVMQIPGHVRIVMRILQRDRSAKRIQFVTAESTDDGRYAPGRASNGPREHFWQWQAGALSHQYDAPGSTSSAAGDEVQGGSGAWIPSGEAPSYRRQLVPPGG